MCEKLLGRVLLQLQPQLPPLSVQLSVPRKRDGLGVCQAESGRGQPGASPAVRAVVSMLTPPRSAHLRRRVHLWPLSGLCKPQAGMRGH